MLLVQRKHIELKAFQKHSVLMTQRGHVSCMGTIRSVYSYLLGERTLSLDYTLELHGRFREENCYKHPLDILI